MAPPPMPEDSRDAEQLRLLVVFHYIYMGLQTAGLAFLGLHYFIMHAVFGMVKQVPEKAPPVDGKVETGAFPVPESIPPEEGIIPVERNQSPEESVNAEEFFSEFGSLFIIFYLIGAVFLIAYIILNFLAARSISQRKGRTFSIVVAGLNCVSFPFGTTLGVFTLVVLCRQSVMNTYKQSAA